LQLVCTSAAIVFVPSVSTDAGTVNVTGDATAPPLEMGGSPSGPVAAFWTNISAALMHSGCRR
jgi:hypothetical protein